MSERTVAIARWSALREGVPASASALGVELVVVRHDGRPHVLAAICPHRGADLSTGRIEGECLVCPDHGWDFVCETGESPSIPGERVQRFDCWVDGDDVVVEASALATWARDRRVEPDYTL